MKRIFRAASSVLFCCLLSLGASAAVLQDPMTDFANRSHVKYKMLTKSTEKILATMTDPTALSCPDSQAYGWVEYNVTGAESITLELYSQMGTFATHNTQREQYTLEPLYGDVAGAMLARALYSPSSRNVYMRYDGTLYLAEYHELDSAVRFTPASKEPIDLIGYGATVYAYAPSSGWTPLPLQNGPTISMPDQKYYSELLTAKVPPGATMVRVMLSGDGVFPTVGESLEPMTPNYSVALASVKLEGAALAYGVPAPVVTRPPAAVEEEPIEEIPPSSSSTRSSSTRASSARASSARSSTKSSAGPSSKFAGVIEPVGPGGPKFTGVIVDPATKAKQQPPDKSESEPEPDQKPPERPMEHAATAPVTYEQPSAVVYQVEGGAPAPAANNASAWIMGYSVLLTGAILAVLLKSKRK